MYTACQLCLCVLAPQTMVETPATWKKLSAVSQASAHPGSMAVKLERSYHRQDEDETEVESGNVAKGTMECTVHVHVDK